MLIATLMALLTERDYIGFIDADNYSPGAVLEYIKSYAAGFAMANSSYAMVRILWSSKPRILQQGIRFEKQGRASRISNECLNSFLSDNKRGGKTEIIQTGNAGEHAITSELVKILPFASGFAVEPYELVFIFEEFGDFEKEVEIFQIESKNPHFHEKQEKQHINNMLISGLGTIYHSPLCTPTLKEMITDKLLYEDAITPGEKPPQPVINPPPKDIDLQKFKNLIREHMDSYLIS
jgi:mannosyl-3-phosphoglycerate synthase